MGDHFTLVATASSGLPVTFTLSSGPCTLNGNTVTGPAAVVGAGTITCMVMANQGGNAQYLPAMPVTVTITIEAHQNITLTIPGSLPTGTSGPVSATSTSGLGVTFTSATPSICTVSNSAPSGSQSNGTVTGVSAGSCVVVATAAGGIVTTGATSTNYGQAQIPGTISIGTTQTITFGAAPLVLVGGTGTVSATASSLLPVTFGTSSPSSICTVSGNVVTGVGLGSCIVTANQPGNAQYLPATQVTQTVPIGATQTITFGAAPVVLPGGTGTLSATASSGLPVSFATTSPSSICMVSGNVVTGVSAGYCTVTANQPGNAQYFPAPQATQTVPIGSTQTITFTQYPTTLGLGDHFTLVATASSGLTVTFTLNSGPCTLNGNLVTGPAAVGPGTITCMVTASQGGNAQYLPAIPVTVTITIETHQNIALTTPGSLATGASGPVSATSTSHLAVTFTSATPSICTVSNSAPSGSQSNGTVTGVSAGSCMIVATVGRRHSHHWRHQYQLRPGSGGRGDSDWNHPDHHLWCSTHPGAGRWNGHSQRHGQL